jgi:hypothetical protein
MKTELNNMVRAYAGYLNAVGDFINATDEQTRNKLIAFDIIEMLSVDLGEQIEEAHKVLTENNPNNEN